MFALMREKPTCKASAEALAALADSQGSLHAHSRDVRVLAPACMTGLELLLPIVERLLSGHFFLLGGFWMGLSVLGPQVCSCPADLTCNSPANI